MFEVWQEVSVELARENVRPVSPDLDCLTEIERMFAERTASIVSSQRELIQNQTQQDLTEEQACYAKVNISETVNSLVYIWNLWWIKAT